MNKVGYLSLGIGLALLASGVAKFAFSDSVSDADERRSVATSNEGSSVLKTIPDPELSPSSISPSEAESRRVAYENALTEYNSSYSARVEKAVISFIQMCQALPADWVNYPVQATGLSGSYRVGNDLFFIGITPYNGSTNAENYFFVFASYSNWARLTDEDNIWQCAPQRIADPGPVLQ